MAVDTTSSYGTIMSALLEHVNFQTPTALYALDNGDEVLLDSHGVSVDMVGDQLQLTSDTQLSRWRRIEGQMHCDKVKAVFLRGKGQPLPVRGDDGTGGGGFRGEELGVIKYRHCKQALEEVRVDARKKTKKLMAQELYIDSLSAKIELLDRELQRMRQELPGKDLTYLDSMRDLTRKRDGLYETSLLDRRRQQRFGRLPYDDWNSAIDDEDFL